MVDRTPHPDRDLRGGLYKSSGMGMQHRPLPPACQRPAHPTATAEKALPCCFPQTTSYFYGTTHTTADKGHELPPLSGNGGKGSRQCGGSHRSTGRPGFGKGFHPRQCFGGPTEESSRSRGLHCGRRVNAPDSQDRPKGFLDCTIQGFLSSFSFLKKRDGVKNGGILTENAYLCPVTP